MLFRFKEVLLLDIYVQERMIGAVEKTPSSVKIQVRQQFRHDAQTDADATTVGCIREASRLGSCAKSTTFD
jgi:hypothetical protein